MAVIRELKNNIKIVMEKIPYVQSMSVGLWFNTGSADENDENAGISHFIEHMLFKGTETRSAKDIATDIEKIGAQINAFTGKEATCYYVKVLNENYKKATDVLVDMVTNSVLDPTELNRERQVICEEIKMSKDVPDELAHDTVMELVFKGSKYSSEIIGSPETLKNINREVMREYLNAHYTTDNLVVSVAGNFDEDDVCDYFSKQFMTLPSTKKKTFIDSDLYIPSSKVIVKDIEQSHICLANRSINLLDSRYYSLTLLNNILGGGMSSRLFQNIREEQGLAYSVFSALSSLSDDGYTLIYAGVSHEKIADALAGIREELNKIAISGVTQAELNASKEQIKAAYAFEQENVAGRMVKNGKNTTLYGKVFDTFEVIDQYSKITLDDIMEAQKIVSDFSRYTAVVVTNKEFDLEEYMRGQI